ncbi:hypothetical protein [Thalassoroseus pseudoceratinae]|uniref:hypothetical protein n=1 Tax=Thalassoroseus pseudoceratinae TaxID=2713176 RepID=UPI00141EB702|nr:hypothetical protein [Thalassoroseus pseudoceratinae]
MRKLTHILAGGFLAAACCGTLSAQDEDLPTLRFPTNPLVETDLPPVPLTDNNDGDGIPENTDAPPITRKRYGSILTNGSYQPVLVPAVPTEGEYHQPGGPRGVTGSPYYYTVDGRRGPLYKVHDRQGVPWGLNHSSYEYHFGPGHYRNAEGGHYRFPYYTYRAPWYFPGHPIYNRDTNLPW